MKTTAVAAVILGGVLTSPLARGAGETEWQLAFRAGLGNVSFDGRKAWGLATALEVDYGLSDAWGLRATLAGSFHPVDKTMVDGGPTLPGGTLRTMAALAGLTYTIDVLRLIPYGFFELGAIRFDGAVQRAKTVFAAELGIGADYFLTRRWTTGVSFQYLFAPEDLLADPINIGQSPFSFSATWRVSRIF